MKTKTRRLGSVGTTAVYADKMKSNYKVMVVTPQGEAKLGTAKKLSTAKRKAKTYLNIIKKTRYRGR